MMKGICVQKRCIFRIKLKKDYFNNLGPFYLLYVRSHNIIVGRHYIYNVFVFILICIFLSQI